MTAIWDVDQLSLSIENLIVKVGQGDREAFAVLYSETSGQIYGLLLMMLRQKTAAEEIMQDVYVKAWQNAERFCPEKGSGMAWLTTIARRTAIDRIRASNREIAGKEQAAHQVEAITAEAMHKDDMVMSDVWRCMKGLDSDTANLISMAFFIGFTHEEIAENTGQPLGTVKSRIRRGLIGLKGCLGA